MIILLFYIITFYIIKYGDKCITNLIYQLKQLVLPKIKLIYRELLVIVNVKYFILISII